VPPSFTVCAISRVVGFLAPKSKRRGNVSLLIRL
jgi:hypothetical protein